MTLCYGILYICSRNQTKDIMCGIVGYIGQRKASLIHNGTIENYAVLKEKFQAKDYIFKDTCIGLSGTIECLAPLITTVPLE